MSRLPYRTKIGLLALGTIVLAACGPRGGPPLPARGVLVQGESPREGLGAYGYLVFTREARTTVRPRYLLVCSAYLRNLRPVAEYLAEDQDVDLQSLMVTHWLVRERVRETADCELLIDTYDYAQATKIASSIGKLGVEGPILVAWEQPFERVSPSSNALVLDLSNFADEDLDRALGIWKDRITRNPAVWKDGFNLELVREAFRSLIQKYGEQIVGVVEAIFA